MERLSLTARLSDKPHAAVVAPFDPEVLIYKVAGKVFALHHLGEQTLTLKCDLHLSEILRQAHPEITPGHRVERRHWISVALDGDLDDVQIAALIDQSYDLVRGRFTKAQRSALFGEG